MGREFKSVFEKVRREERRDQFSKVHTFLNSKRVFLKMLNYQVVARVACALAFPVPLLQWFRCIRTLPGLLLVGGALWGKPMGWWNGTSCDKLSMLKGLSWVRISKHIPFIVVCDVMCFWISFLFSWAWLADRHKSVSMANSLPLCCQSASLVTSCIKVFRAEVNWCLALSAGPSATPVWRNNGGSWCGKSQMFDASTSFLHVPYMVSLSSQKSRCWQSRSFIINMVPCWWQAMLARARVAGRQSKKYQTAPEKVREAKVPALQGWVRCFNIQR